MTEVLQKAQAHYQTLGRRKILVPEWGEPGAPFVVYATPMTIGQRDQIRDKGHVNSAKMFVDVLLTKAQKEDGSAAFGPEDRHGLTHEVDDRIVSRIALEILDGPSDEDLEKNSGPACVE